MDKRNWVIANIPVRKGLEERYCVHVNIASVVIIKFKGVIIHDKTQKAKILYELQ